MCVKKMERPSILETCHRQVRALREHLAPIGSPWVALACSYLPGKREQNVLRHGGVSYNEQGQDDARTNGGDLAVGSGKKRS